MVKRKNSLFGNLYLFLTFLVLYLPIFYLMIYSFNKAGNMNQFTGWTLEHYQAVFSDGRLLVIVCDTLIIAFLSALFATIIGTFGAIFIHNVKRGRQKRILLNLNNVLMVSPDVIIGASLLILFTMIGFKLGFYSVLLAHIAFNVPIVVIMVLPKLEELNQSLVVAARDLGANAWQVFSKVLLPLITPGILSGFFMAFTYSLDDFAVTFFVSGNGFSTLSVEIFSRARRGVSLEINALSTLIFLFSLGVILAYYAISKQQLKRSKRGKDNVLLSHSLGR